MLLGVALLVVLVILLIVYRTPVLPLVVLISAVLALGLAVGGGLPAGQERRARPQRPEPGDPVHPRLGAATDYSLLLVSRFREELRDTESKYDAMRVAWNAVAGADPGLRRHRDPGPAVPAALGPLQPARASARSAPSASPARCSPSLTLLPAALVLLGRAAYWPFRPTYGSEHPDATRHVGPGVPAGRPPRPRGLGRHLRGARRASRRSCRRSTRTRSRRPSCS